MGSALIRQGVAPGDTLRANIDRPELVRSIHAAYLGAGSDILTCNTFGVRPGGAWSAQVRAGYALAAEAATANRRAVAIWLSIPPCAAATGGSTIREIMAGAAGAPPVLLIETCTALIQAREALAACRAAASGPIAVTAHFTRNGVMPDGTQPEMFAAAMAGEGASIVGANCGDTPQSFIDIAARMRAVTDLVLLVQPSAGLPDREPTGTLRYPVAPAEFASVCAQIADAGADIVGGCCGVTPAHLAAAVASCTGRVVSHSHGGHESWFPEG